MNSYSFPLPLCWTLSVYKLMPSAHGLDPLGSFLHPLPMFSFLIFITYIWTLLILSSFSVSFFSPFLLNNLLDFYPLNLSFKILLSDFNFQIG